MGLRPPAEVKKATDTYRAEQDVLAAFLEECCIVKPEAEVKAGELYAAYKAWGGGSVESQKAFAMRLRERGFTPDQGAKGVRVWSGFGLLENDL